jgi:hypothetical protein
MAGFASIAAAGQSIVRLLNDSFEVDPPVPDHRTQAVLVRTTDFQEAQVATLLGGNALSVFLYRVDFNKAMRAAWSAAGSVDGRAHLALDLHYLLTPWSDNAQHEHRILGRAIQCLEETPVLAGALLVQGGEWSDIEALQIVMEEVSTEALMRTFDSLPTDYRLSMPYIARVLRMDGREARPAPPVRTAVRGLIPEVPR